MAKYCSKCGEVPEWFQIEQHHTGNGDETIPLCHGCHGDLHREYDLAFSDKPKKQFSLYHFTKEFLEE